MRADLHPTVCLPIKIQRWTERMNAKLLAFRKAEVTFMDPGVGSNF